VANKSRHICVRKLIVKGFQPLGGAGALDDAAHEHHWPQTALGLIVGRGHVGTLEAGEVEFPLDVRKEPGLDASEMQSQLDADFQWPGRLQLGETGSVDIRGYEFNFRE
jgi:hypothetical protein